MICVWVVFLTLNLIHLFMFIIMCLSWTSYPEFGSIVHVDYNVHSFNNPHVKLIHKHRWWAHSKCQVALAIDKVTSKTDCQYKQLSFNRLNDKNSTWCAFYLCNQKQNGNYTLYGHRGRSKTFQNEGAEMGASGGWLWDSKWRLSIDPCIRCYFIGGAQGGWVSEILTEGAQATPASPLATPLSGQVKLALELSEHPVYLGVTASS